jgi:hypothetical protein
VNSERQRLIDLGLQELPALHYPGDGRNGEALDTDEAAVWKRVLDYRIASYLKPRRLLETHPGLGISTALYRCAAPRTEVVQVELPLVYNSGPFDLVDVDPFGAPWDTLEQVKPIISQTTIIQVSNGEAHAVRRNLKRGQKFPTKNTGRKMPIWVVDEYLPRLERLLGLRTQFFYAFPTTVRVILAQRKLPKFIWRGCPHWMWWLAKYAPGDVSEI